MERFQSIGCINCHDGPMFSDFTAHVLGVPDNPKLPESDSGVNKTYAFRTPSLRNLSATAPYMHNGVFADASRGDQLLSADQPRWRAWRADGAGAAEPAGDPRIRSTRWRGS